MISVVYCTVGSPPVVLEVASALEAFQHLVGGGYIEYWAQGAGVFLVCNEEGRARLRPNRVHPQLGTIYGPFFLTAAAVGGEERSLSPAEAQECLATVASWPHAIGGRP